MIAREIENETGTETGIEIGIAIVTGIGDEFSYAIENSQDILYVLITFSNYASFLKFLKIVGLNTVSTAVVKSIRFFVHSHYKVYVNCSRISIK